MSLPLSDVVLYEVADAIAVITLNRPQARNALNAPLRAALLEAFTRFNADDSARVAILTGAGEQAFSSGGDLKEMSSTQLRIPPPDFVPQPGRTIEMVKPIIAAVNGIAYGGGFLLAQSCDLCIATEDARFAITEARWGRGAPWAAPLARLIPPRVAMEMMLTAQPIGAHRAYEIGLVNVVVGAGELMERAKDTAGAIAANAPLSVLAMKQTVRASMESGQTEALAKAEAIFESVYLSEDALEGPRAFAERREPSWTGR